MNAYSASSPLVPAKAPYHHGDLKQVLVQAAYELVPQTAAENFALADASRLSGVSTAARYKYFRDRNVIIELVIEQASTQWTAGRSQSGCGPSSTA